MTDNSTCLDRSTSSRVETNDFKLERLKYVYDQQKFLNEHSHKYLTFFQSLVTALTVAAVAVFMSWKNLSIPLEVARTAIDALEWLFIASGVFVFLVVSTTMASWWDYRKEETELLNDVVGEAFRKPPSIYGIWRWFETWLILLVTLTVSGAVFYIERYVLPLMK